MRGGKKVSSKFTILYWAAFIAILGHMWSGAASWMPLNAVFFASRIFLTSFSHSYKLSLSLWKTPCHPLKPIQITFPFFSPACSYSRQIQFISHIWVYENIIVYSTICPGFFRTAILLIFHSFV